jgi:hypothetical protein
MARGVRTGRYSRRSLYSGGRARWILIAIAAAVFVLLSLVISVVVGISLGKRAEKYPSLPKYDLSVEEYYSSDKKVGAVDAYAFSPTANVNSYIVKGITDFSLYLRTSDGELAFSSKVAEKLGGIQAEDGKYDLGAIADKIHVSGGRVCAYFYVGFLEIEDVYLRELQKAYEIALINEASAFGADEIMLIGLEANEENIDELQEYVSEAAFAAENAALGVLIAPETFKLSESDVYFASRLRSVCDFAALDLRDVPVASDGSEEEVSELEKVISEMEFYVRSYNMRVVLATENAALYDEAKALGVVSIQIVEK